MSLQHNDIYQQRIRVNYRHVKWTRNLLLWIIGLGFVGIVAFTLGEVVFSTLFLISGGSFLSSFIIGFLFAIPRSTQGENTNSKIGKKDEQTGEIDSNSRNQRLETNTNLQEISDWLTKMIVGIGLTQLYRVPNLLDTLSTFLSKGFSKNLTMPSFVTALIVFSGSCGFLSGYLMTRLFLASAFALADELLDAEEYSVQYEDLAKSLKSLNDEQVGFLNKVFESNEKGKNYIIPTNVENNQEQLNSLRTLIEKSLIFVSTIESIDESSGVCLGVSLTSIAMENKEKIQKKIDTRSNKGN